MNLRATAPLLLGTGICLGLGIPLSKWATAEGVDALAFATWPTLAAGLLLGALGALREGLPRERRALLRFGLLAGLFGHALPMSALFTLTASAGAGFAALAFTLPPVFTLLVVLLLRLEAPRLPRLGAVALGLCGALLLAGSGGGADWAGLGPVLWLLAIPASIGAANVYRSRHMPAGVGGAWLSAATLSGSAALLLAFGLASARLTAPASPAAWGWLLLQTAALVLGYLLYFALQRRAEPVTFSFMGYVSMATGVAAGTLAFGEQLPWTTLPALAAIGAALWLLQRSPGPAPATARAPVPAAPPHTHHGAPQ